MLVSESFARRAWPGDAAAVGKRVKIPLPNTPYSQQWLTVIGVVADARYRELERTRLDVYVSHLQAAIPLNSPDGAHPRRSRHGHECRTCGCSGMDPNVPMVAAMRMSDVVTARLARRRFTAQLFVTFALVALTLAVLGLYALLANAVTSRTREIGIRLAIGARPADISREVTRWGLGLTAVGLLFGLSTALAGGRVIDSLLYGVAARDPLTLTVAPLALVAVATLGCASAGGPCEQGRPSNRAARRVAYCPVLRPGPLARYRPLSARWGASCPRQGNPTQLGLLTIRTFFRPERKRTQAQRKEGVSWARSTISAKKRSAG